MKTRFVHILAALVVFAGLSGAFVTLVRQSHRPADEAAGHTAGDHCCPPAGPARTATAPCADGCEHETHKIAGPAGPEARFQAPCEHNVAIIDCDQCRYEAGVARIDPALAQGLVEAQPVHLEPRATRQLQCTGEVQLDLTRVVEIAAAGSGRVEEVRRILGDTVEVADVLAVIQSSEFGAAQAGFLEAQARLELARQTHAREKQLHAQKIGSAADYLAARNDLAAAQAAVAAAHQQLQRFGLSAEQIDSQARADAGLPFGQLTLRAPIRGTIIEQNLVRGRLVDPASTLYQIADLSRVWVWGNVYESDLGPLQERMASAPTVPAQIRVSAFGPTAFRGTVDMIGSQVDRPTRTVKVRVLVDNPEGKLKPGMFVSVAIALEDPRPVVRVPRTAVLADAGQSFVFTRLRDDLWARRDVTVGRADGGLVEVHHGLREGDIIATRGAFMFKSEILKEKMGAGCAH